MTGGCNLDAREATDGEEMTSHRQSERSNAMTTKKTATWALATVVVAATLLALADTGYADRDRDRDRRPAPSVRDGRRDSDRSGHRDGRDFDRGRITNRQPWGRHDRNVYFYRPPVLPVQVVYLIPVQMIGCQRIVFGTTYVSFGFSARW
jgi:hypothetical protein